MPDTPPASASWAAILARYEYQAEAYYTQLERFVSRLPDMMGAIEEAEQRMDRYWAKRAASDS